MIVARITNVRSSMARDLRDKGRVVAMRELVDIFVDHLFHPLPALGAELAHDPVLARLFAEHPNLVMIEVAVGHHVDLLMEPGARKEG
jgi:hypothetical protein